MHTPLEITRFYNAPITEVFEAFSTSESLKEWWGPKGFDMEVKTFEFEPGGIFHFVLHGPGGFDMWAKWEILEIEAPHLFRFINSFSNPAGETVQAPDVPFGPDWPLEMVTIFKFTEEAGKSRLDFNSYPYHASEASNRVFFQNIHNMEQGFGETFQGLEKYLAESGEK
ncbi:MAG: SRPBCC domain-containing protein [Algoriphagus sp.]|nr:SRPBCC domain-containing protein [Algoriphagus sp.]